jgi:hypothetical protein
VFLYAAESAALLGLPPRHPDLPEVR